MSSLSCSCHREKKAEGCQREGRPGKGEQSLHACTELYVFLFKADTHHMKGQLQTDTDSAVQLQATSHKCDKSAVTAYCDCCAASRSEGC